MTASFEGLTPDVGLTTPASGEAQRVVLGHLLVRRDRGDLTDDEFTDLGQMLGVFEEGT